MQRENTCTRWQLALRVDSTRVKHTPFFFGVCAAHSSCTKQSSLHDTCTGTGTGRAVRSTATGPDANDAASSTTTSVTLASVRESALQVAHRTPATTTPASCVRLSSHPSSSAVASGLPTKQGWDINRCRPWSYTSTIPVSISTYAHAQGAHHRIDCRQRILMPIY